MKKVLLKGLLCLVLWFANGLQAQKIIDTWGFATGVDTTLWIDISGHDSTLIAGGNLVSGRSGLINIGFPFTLGTTTHTKFSTNINGTVRLGNTLIPASGYAANPLSTNMNNGPKIEPFGMEGRFYSNCYTRMARLGVAGDRVVVIETRMSGKNWSEQGYVCFQVQLFETGGFRIVYGETYNYSAGYTSSGGGAQTGVVAATSTGNKDVIFFDFVTNEAVRFDGNCTVRNPDGLWVEEGRWYELKPDSNYCPFPPTVTSTSTNPSNIILTNSYGGLVNIHLTIPATGLDTIWPKELSYFNIGGGYNPRTTYTCTVQSVCDNGHTSYRSGTFQFTTSCGPVTHLPWLDNFSGSNTTQCWDNSQFTNSSQQWKVQYGDAHCEAISAEPLNEWLVSPIINLPSEEGILMRWKYMASALNGVAPTVDVRIAPCAEDGTVDSTDWTTLMTINSAYDNNYTTLETTLDNWSGQRVKVAFVRTGTGGSLCNIDDVELLLEQIPVVNLTAPSRAFVGDTVVLTGSVIRGMTSGLQWQWHSLRTDTWSTDSVFAVVYDSACNDTVTLIVSNAYGADTATAEITVEDCRTSIPWVENFETTGWTFANYFSGCWTLNGWTKWHTSTRLRNEHGEYQYYDHLIYSSGTNNSNNCMLSPAIAIPATNIEHLKFWVECAGDEMLIKTTTASASTNPNDYTDTLLFIEASGNDYMLQWHLADLAPYAGDTIRIGIFRTGVNYLNIINTVMIDYDTLPVLGDIVGRDTVNNDDAFVFIAPLLRGDTTGLSYTWSSTLGGSILQNNFGDTATITYSNEGDDTLTVIISNSFGVDTVIKTVHVVGCPAITELPWTETLENGIWCWHIPMGSDWGYYRTPYLNYIYSTDDTTYGDCWIISPKITIPSDVTENVHFFWKVAQDADAGTQHYEVLASISQDYTNLANYSILYEDSATHPYFWQNDNYDYLSVNLSSQFAGETIRIAFWHHARNNITDRALYILGTEVRSTNMPMLESIEVANDIYTEDGPQNAVAHLIEGNLNGLTYTWYSSLNGDTTVTTSDTLSLTYNTEGIDTLRLVASNAYGSDTVYAIVHVHHCSVVSLPLIEPFKSDSTMGCWRMWNFSPDNDWAGWRVEDHITSGYNVICAGTYYNEANYWLVTPELDITSDGGNLRVKVYGGTASTRDTYLTILASTTGHSDTTNFTDTLYHDNPTYGGYVGWTNVAINLSDYAGQHVRLAFVHTGSSNYSYGICLDSLSIYYEYLPHATVTHASPLVDIPTIYRASLNNCVSTGLQYTWHSTLMDTTVTGTSDSLMLMYTVEGTDTVTLTVRNNYGYDTVTLVVEVLDCIVRFLPYYEDFEDVEAVAFNVSGGALPGCWENIWTGTATNMAPHVIPNNGYSFINGIPDNAIIMMAGSNADYVNNAYVILPPFAERLQDLLIAFDYRQEDISFGTLSVGYIDRSGNYTAVTALTPHDGAYLHDTVSFSRITAAGGQIAFHWNCTRAYYGVVIDNIAVFSDTTPSLPPRIALEAPDTVNVTDTVIVTVLLQFGDTARLTYTWHSSLLDTTWGPSPSDTLSLIYTLGGLDTITVIADNNFGRHQTKAIVWVSDCNLKRLPYFEDFDDIASLNRIGVTSTTGTPLYDIPFCWESPHSYSYNDNLVLCVTSQGAGSNNTTNKIEMWSGTGSFTTNYVVLPGFGNDLNGLALTLDYLPGVNGTLSVGYIVGETYTSVQILTNQATLNSTLNMFRDTVYFRGITAPPDARIAIHYYNMLSNWNFVLLDNVKVFRDTTYTPPVPDTVWHTVTVNMEGAGFDITQHHELSVSGAGRYPDSTTVRLTALFGNGMVFWYWVTSAHDTIRENPFNFIITSDTAFTAVFGPSHIGIDEVKASLHNIEVYPNPASGTVTVKVNSSGPLQVTVTDINGRKVFSTPLCHSASLPLDISRLTTGTYFLRVTTEEGCEVKKLIVR